MSTTKQAIRRRRQAKHDPRFKNHKAQAKARRLKAQAKAGGK
jgi:hypothetical protein